MPELAITMPKMSMTMEEGTMVRWLKQPGDQVRQSEPICEVATDKVDMEVESPYEGTLSRIVADENAVIGVGEPIGFILSDSDDLLGGLFDEPAPQVTAVVETPQAPSAPMVTAGAAAETAAVPAARTLAAEAGIDIASVAGTGPWGAVRVDDVAKAVEAAQVTPPASTVVEPRAEPLAVATPPQHSPSSTPDPDAARRARGRQVLARVMSQSAAVPQFTVYADLDLRRTDEIRKTELGGASWTAILVRAQAMALAAVPALNTYWNDDAAQPCDGIGIAIAVDSPAGLVAPVIRNPQLGPLGDVVRQLNERVQAARNSEVTLDMLSGGTSVFSNLGGFGVDRFNALLTPPQSTALSAGAIGEQVYATGPGAIATRLQCTVGLTIDHRTADGADGARFIQELRALFAEPLRLR